MASSTSSATSTTTPCQLVTSTMSRPTPLSAASATLAARRGPRRVKASQIAALQTSTSATASTAIGTSPASATAATTAIATGARSATTAAIRGDHDRRLAGPSGGCTFDGTAEARADLDVEDLCLGGCELLVGEDTRLVQLTEFLELLHRVLFRRRRGGHLLRFLGGPLLFFLAGPPALLAMLNGPGGAAGDGAHGGYTGNAAK